MGAFIIIATLVVCVCLFKYAYKYNMELQRNNLIKNIDSSFITDETKHDYVTYVFAIILDRVIDQSKLKHLN